VLVNGPRLVSALPASVSRAIARLNSRSLRLHDTFALKEYAPLQ
jgi:hypothetical protein